MLLTTIAKIWMYKNRLYRKYSMGLNSPDMRWRTIP
nr:MAG TPA: hypothetical protein [Caudoviricetes sp.]